MINSIEDPRSPVNSQILFDYLKEQGRKEGLSEDWLNENTLDLTGNYNRKMIAYFLIKTGILKVAA